MIIEQVTETLLDHLETAVCTWRMYLRLAWFLIPFGLCVVAGMFYFFGVQSDWP